MRPAQLCRPSTTEEDREQLAPINPGNSGGPLISSKLVGINSAIIATAGGNVGIGFAVPWKLAKAVIAQLEKFGAASRPHRLAGAIGYSDIAAAGGLSEVAGAIIAAVETGAPPDRAGLRADDVIMEIDGKRVLSASDVRNRICLREAPPASRSPSCVRESARGWLSRLRPLLRCRDWASARPPVASAAVAIQWAVRRGTVRLTTG